MTVLDAGTIAERPGESPAGTAEPRGRSLARALMLATLASIAYGGWAALANADHGSRAALTAGLTQAAMSFVTAFCLTMLGDWILRRFSRGSSQLAAAALIMPATIFAMLASIHTLARTPNVLATILPSMIGGSAFYIAYVAVRRARIGRGKLRYAASPPR